MRVFNLNTNKWIFLAGLLLICLLVSGSPVSAAPDDTGIMVSGNTTIAEPNLTADPEGTEAGSSFGNSAAGTGLVSQVMFQGNMIDIREIGPGLPPKDWQKDTNRIEIRELASQGLNPSDVPVLKWSYGCTPTAAAMYFGYYDRHHYPDIYTGAVDGGLFPMTNEIWGTSPEGYGECPMSASHNGIDGRTTKGHVDDYYYQVGSLVDPYYGYWNEHTPQDSIADFIGTSQYYNYNNRDGYSTFVAWADGSPLYDWSGGEPGYRDVAHALKLFAESRGYQVTTNYNQYIYGLNGNTKGFTFDQYKAELNAKNPVLLQLDGHTMLGVGYSGTNTMIVLDTWDYSYHSMTWGGTYGGMAHLGVTILHLQPVAAFIYSYSGTTVPVTVQFTDRSTGSPESWAWDFGDGDTTNATEQNPIHTYQSAGTYSVRLTVANSGMSDYVVKTDIIHVSPSAVVIPLPGYANPPTDPDSDGLYEDLNGNGVKDLNDVVLFFKHITWIAANEPVAAFDFNGNGVLDMNDVILLFHEI
jgi:PKD repeat protein